MSIPPEFLCSLGHNIMENPVRMPDGHIYEHDAIEHALKEKPISQFTQQPMKIEDAVPETELKIRIDQYLSSHVTQPLRISSIDLLKFQGLTIPDPKDPKQSFLNIKVTPKTLQQRQPVAFVAIIDVSGSMGEASGPAQEGVSFTRIDLVKHSLRTIISALQPQDQLSLITFNSEFSVLNPLDNVTEENKLKLMDHVKNMRSGGGTNIWPALSNGIDIIKKVKPTEFTKTILVFTDGQTEEPSPDGLVGSLKKKIDPKMFDYTISTFGFGYDMNSVLLNEIATVGNGLFGYCPDCTMVGTVFINFLANCLTTLSSSSTLEVEKKQYPFALYNGCTRNYNATVPTSSALKIKCTFVNPSTKQKLKIQQIRPAETSEEIMGVMDQYWRTRLIEVIQQGIDIEDDAGVSTMHKKVMDLYNELSQIPQEKVTPFIETLLGDLYSESPNHGQVEKAFTEEFYLKWGRNYLLHFLRCHVLEICGNFKDISLQGYCGAPFNAAKKAANVIFNSLPPPKAEALSSYTGGGSFKMSTFNTCYSGCFDGNAVVSLKNGRTKKVKDLQKGDFLENDSRIKCIVKMETNKDARSDCVELNGCLFTPYHPVKFEGAWVFPIEISKVCQREVDTWYNLVLDGDSVVKLNGIEAITLGHGKEEGILKHPYFGTKKVVEALEKYEGFESGTVEVRGKSPIRDESGLITEYF